MKKIYYIFLTLIVLLVFGGCSNQQKKDIQIYIQDTFGYKEIKSVNKTVPPILGGNSNYYVSFIDKSDNDCFLIVDLNFDKYILIYNNLLIEQNSQELQDRFKDLIQSQLNTEDTSPEYAIKSDLTDLNIKKVKSNLDTFKNGEVGEMHIQKDFIYKDKGKGDAVGPSQVKTIVLIDTDTKQYFTFDENNKPIK